jgi:hypothetical protein
VIDLVLGVGYAASAVVAGAAMLAGAWVVGVVVSALGAGMLAFEVYRSARG